MNDRRHYPRINEQVVWRAAGLRAPRHPTVDLSLGGMLIYSDEAIAIGSRLEVELLMPNEPTIEIQASVVRVDTLPKGAPARYDVALQFLDIEDDARGRLAARLARDLGEDDPIVEMLSQRPASLAARQRASTSPASQAYFSQRMSQGQRMSLRQPPSTGLAGQAPSPVVSHVLADPVPEGDRVSTEPVSQAPITRRVSQGPIHRSALEARLRAAAASETRIDEQQAQEVHHVEEKHEDEGLLQPTASASFSRRPDGDRHICDQDGNQQELLHCSSRPSQAYDARARNVNARGGSRLSVLFVTPYLPSPPLFGAQRRLHGLIAGLSKSHDVSVLSLIDPSEDQSEALHATEAYCRRVAVVPSRRASSSTLAKRLLQLGSLLSKQSYEWLLHRERSLDASLDQLLSLENFDVVQFEFPHLAAYRTKQPVTELTGPAFVLDEHNIEYDIVRQTAATGADALRRAYSAINWPKIRSEERRAWARLDGCTLTSARDQEILLKESPETRTAVVPNGVDLDFFQPQGAPPASPNLLFFGAIDYHPNTDGLLYFHREIFPLLSRDPSLKLRIVGRKPPESITSLAGPQIEVTGAVDDVRPYIEQASVVVVPLRMGGGTRLKIIEAMAMGKAIVSTSLGAEGIDLVPGRDILIADDPAGFAAHVRRLLDDPALAARMGASARRVAEKHYGWGASVERLSAFYGEVIEARGA